MHLASDHPHPIGKRGKCRVRIYEPDEEGLRWGDRVVVLCSEVATNGGPGITVVAEAIREGVAEAFHLDDPLWIEHV